MGRYQEKITYGRLREVLDYNEHTGVFKWKVPSGSRCEIGVELKPSASTKYLLITNGYNSKLRKDSKTGIKGVTWDSRRDKYRVTIVVNKVQIHLGRYSDIELATLVSEEARAKLHKEFCRYE